MRAVKKKMGESALTPALKLKRRVDMNSLNKKKVGWFWLDNEVFDMELLPSTFLVYAYLVKIADRNSEIAKTSVRNLSATLKLSTTTIQKALKELEEKNMIRKETSPKRQFTTFVLMPKEEWAYQKTPRPVSKAGTPVCQKTTHPVSKNDTHKENKPSKPVDTQAPKQALISNKNQKPKTKTSLPKKASEDELLNRVRGLNLRRLREGEALFLLLNSSLPIDTSLREIQRADRQSGIREPFAYLIRFLGIDLLHAKGKEWLNREDFGEEDFPENEEELHRGKEKLETLLASYGVEVSVDQDTYPPLWKAIINSGGLTEQEEKDVIKVVEQRKDEVMASDIALGIIIAKAIAKGQITRRDEREISLYRHKLFSVISSVH